MKNLPLSRILMTAALVTGTYLLAAGTAGAADKASVEARRDAQIDSRFAAADKNKDGKLTLDEAKAGMPRVAKNFDKIKTGSNDYVTIDEVKAASKKAP